MNSRILASGAMLALVVSQAALADHDRYGRGRDGDRERDYARVVAVEMARGRDEIGAHDARQS